MSRSRLAAEATSWSRLGGQLGLAASGWALLALTALPAGSLLRDAATFGFLFSCPGAALVRHWPGTDRLERLVVAIATSVALAVLVAESLILVGSWSAPLALAILAVVTTVGAISPAVSPAKQQRRER